VALEETAFCLGCPAEVNASVTVSVIVYRSGVFWPFGGRHVTLAPVPVNVPLCGVADHAYVS
jgi:hypothetical protein